jgi:hypothetical protein
MKNQIKNYGNIIALFLMFSSLISYAQVGIGTSTPNENSSLDLQGGTTIDKGFVLPLATTNIPFNNKPIKEGTLLYSDSEKMIYYVVDSSLTSPKYNALSPWFYNPNLNSTDVTTDKNVFIGGTLNVNVGAVFNEASTNADFRVESDGNDHMLFVDGSNDKVGIGKNSPAHKLDVVGDINSSIKIKEGGNDLIPAGVIVMWSGTTAPAGWALCDGGGTGSALRPDLKGRFIVGYNPVDIDYNNVTKNITTAKIGGSKTHNHSIPAHKHTMNHDHQAFNVTIPSSTWDNADKKGCYGAFTSANDEYLQHNADGAISVNPPPYKGDAAGSVNSYTGEKTSFSTLDSDNRPPFYTLAYIIKL